MRRPWEQDAANLVVELHTKVEQLTGFGIRDGDGNLRFLDDDQLAAFIHNAISHRLPGEDVKDPDTQSQRIKSCKVEIKALATDRGPSRPKRLEFLFTNYGPEAVPLKGGRLEWRYTPPRECPKPKAKKPTVAETGGSVNLSTNSVSRIVEPGASMSMHLDDVMSGTLVELLRGDVRDEDIAVSLYASETFGWKATMDGIPEAVKDVANSVLRDIKSKNRE